MDLSRPALPPMYQIIHKWVLFAEQLQWIVYAEICFLTSNVLGNVTSMV